MKETKVRKPKAKTLRIAILNIKVSPKKKEIDTKEFYSDILNKIRKEDIAVNTRSDKYVDIFSMSKYDEKCFFGKFSYYTLIDPEKDWYHRKDKILTKVDFDPELSPNVKNSEYFFIPEAHRLCLSLTSSGIAISQIILFLEAAIRRVVSEDQTVEVIQEKSEDVIGRILKSKFLTKLDIRISYTNDDLNKDFAEFLDQDLKDGQVRNLDLSANSFQKDFIDITQSKLLKGALELSQSNGYAEAVTKESKKSTKISTKEYPREEIIHSTEGSEHIDVYNRIKNLFRNND